jgi:glycosyltransferase involved in cell wall biosynthesis
VFVTQNGDWPACRHNLEYRLFSCDGLVCTNLEYFEKHKQQWFCRFIPNGVDCTRFSPGVARRGEFGLPPDRLIVLMVSALIPSKRVSLAIEAVSRVPNAHLVVAGDGPLRQAIDALAAKLLPTRYSRLSVAPEKMVDLYRSSDIFLHLSKVEAFGIAYLEALACGLPIVAHDSPLVRYIVGADEFLIDTENPAIVAEQIEHVRNAAPVDPKRRSLKVASFSWTKIAAMYRSFLKEVVTSSRGSNAR